MLTSVLCPCWDWAELFRNHLIRRSLYLTLCDGGLSIFDRGMNFLRMVECGLIAVGIV